MSVSVHSAQLDLLGPRPPRFDGWTYREELDRARLTSALRHILFELLDRRWHMIKELALLAGCSEAGASARLRDLKKPKWGRFPVEKRRLPGLETSGVWQYRIVTVTRQQVERIFGNGSG